ncbi:MAG: hypothetical protein KJO38_07115, partial [Gammaproteobacteria bacterium]|nr:hypothetical protein [Gammaproteobacteria bacterium]
AEIPGPDVRKRLSEQSGAVMTWLNTFCSGLDLAPSLVARRREVDRALQGDFDSSLFSGWRAELVGDRLRDWLLDRALPPPELAAALGTMARV